MNRIMVTTDFSVNSKAGIRFALQLAKQTKSKLVFFHSQELPKPTRWSLEKYDSYAAVELKKTHARLRQFVDKISHQTGLKASAAQFVVAEGYKVDEAVIDFAKHTKANYICMSTRGAGAFKKLIGTTASAILTTSPIPVVVVPKTYRVTPISNILYASDFNNLKGEINKVVGFAKPLKARISVYHYDSLLPLKEAKMKLEKTAAKHVAKSVKFYFRRLHVENSLSYHLQKDIKNARPNLVVLFTKQNRGWYERIFLSSKSAALSFDTKTPLLVFRKWEH
jgi:nucleotide-binding universal stress UspA family protein